VKNCFICCTSSVGGWVKKIESSRFSSAHPPPMSQLNGVKKIDQPRIFQPIVLRRGCKYRALCSYVFSPDEKEWVCRELNKNRGSRIKRSRRLVSFSLRYSLALHGLQEWLDLYERGGPMSVSLCGEAEDPVYLDDIACALINGFPATRGPNENQEDYEARFVVRR
jgi:hypothetical protein